VKLKDNFILTEHFKWLISRNSLLILIVNVMIIMKSALRENLIRECPLQFLK